MGQLDKYFLALFAFMPILLAGGFVIGLRWPASRAMPVAFLTAAGLAHQPPISLDGGTLVVKIWIALAHEEASRIDRRAAS